MYRNLFLVFAIAAPAMVSAQSEKDSLVEAVLAAQPNLGIAMQYVASLAVVRCPNTFSIDDDFAARVKEYLRPTASETAGQRRIGKAAHTGFLDGFLYAHDLDKPGADPATNAALWCDVANAEIKSGGILGGFLNLEN